MTVQSRVTSSPADALSLTRSDLERLAAEHAGAGEVTGGSAGERYERAADLVGLIGRRPATRRTLSESPTTSPAGDPVDAELVARYAATRDVAVALEAQLRAQVEHAEEPTLRRLLAACAAWGIAPSSPDLTERARLALPQIQARLAAAPEDGAQLSPAAFLDAAVALVSPTGQLAITAVTPADDIPGLQRAPDLDDEYLTVVAAVRPALARLEAAQLAAAQPFAAWANRVSDPWQTDAQDSRPLVAVYADPSLDLASPPARVAAASLDRFDEVIPAADQRTGAAFGFNAPAARPQQAILLAVPPSTSTPLDQATLAQILVETRELAHARMARPIDLDDELWGLAPTGLLPATGAIATRLELSG